MSFEKYRVHEVAKDFGKQTKDITQILTTYATTPKNHMQVLDDKELSIIFEYLTQHNQVSDLQEIFANAPKAGSKASPAPSSRPSLPRPNLPVPPPGCPRRSWWTPGRQAT